MGGTTFCWNRCPYGVARLPAEFSRAIMQILSGLHDDVSSYIDDITVHTATFDEHCVALKRMLRRLRMANLTLKGSKCLILPESLELLGYCVTQRGVEVQELRKEQFKRFSKPTNRDELQKWLLGRRSHTLFTRAE